MDMISLIEKELNLNAIIDYKPIQPGDICESVADIDYSKEKLRFNPTTSINKGIPNFFNWY